MHKSFLSFFDEVELKLRNIFESLHIFLEIFERKHCQVVRDQLARYSAEVDQILQQMNDHFMLHDEEIEILPDVVTSHSTVTTLRNFTHLSNINILVYMLNTLTSVDLKPKETCAEFLDKCFTKMFSKFGNILCYSNMLNLKKCFYRRVSRFFKKRKLSKQFAFRKRLIVFK